MSTTTRPPSPSPSPLPVSGVGGTAPGRAVLVMIDLSAPGDLVIITHEFVEGPEVPDPHADAVALWGAIEGDWPGWSAQCVTDDRARYLMARGRRRRWGIPDPGPGDR